MALARRAGLVVTLLGASLALGGGLAHGQSGSDIVVVGRIEGVINPVTARYVDRILDRAEERSARAVVFTIDTPGGSLDATTHITQRLLAARVPVVTYVWPSGARAASAGTFITLAGHVAAMAPSTNIGAAHPVDASGQDLGGDLRAKAENDAVAQIRNIATARGHNADWAEDAVRKSVSIGAEEAVRMGVVDLEAASLTDLLAAADGRKVALPQGEATLATRSARIEEDPFTPVEQLLHVVTDPTIAALLFTLGTYGLIFELSNPSLIFPGVVGVIAILLGLFAFGTLDANAAGLALLVFAVVLFVSEIWVASHGILTAGGVAALVIGLVVLFPPGRPDLPGAEGVVSPFAIAALGGTSALFFVLLGRASLRYLRLPVASGTSGLVGAAGIARSDLDPAGIVHVAGEDWSASAAGGPIRQGEGIRVTRVDGVRLVVVPQGKEGI